MGYEELPLRANGQTVTADWFNAIRTYGIGSISTYTAFAGGGQGSATALTTDICRVTTCATNNDSVKLPVSANNKRVLVINETAQTLAVFPQTGEQIDALGANTAISISAYGSITFIANTSLKWASITKIGSISNSDIASNAGIVLTKLAYPVVQSKTTTYTALISDDVILASTSGGAWELALPTAVGNSGKILRVVKTDTSTNLLTINPNASETIFGKTTIVLSGLYDAVEFVSDNANWVPTSIQGNYRMVAAKIGGHATTPTVSQEVGAWISTTSRSNIGIYGITIRAGIFSDVPHVQLLAERNLDNDRYSLGVWTPTQPTSTSISMHINYTDDVGGTTDARNERDDSSNIWVRVWGPR